MGLFLNGRKCRQGKEKERRRKDTQSMQCASCTAQTCCMHGVCTAKLCGCVGMHARVHSCMQGVRVCSHACVQPGAGGSAWGGGLLQRGDGGTGVAVRWGVGGFFRGPLCIRGPSPVLLWGNQRAPPPRSLRVCIDNIPRAQRCLSQFKPKPDRVLRVKREEGEGFSLPTPRQRSL